MVEAIRFGSAGGRRSQDDWKHGRADLARGNMRVEVGRRIYSKSACGDYMPGATKIGFPIAAFSWQAPAGRDDPVEGIDRIGKFTRLNG